MRVAEQDTIWTRDGLPVEELPDPFASTVPPSSEPRKDSSQIHRPIQRRPLQSVNRSVALEIANQMAVAHCEAGSVVHKEKRKACAGGTQR